LTQYKKFTGDLKPILAESWHSIALGDQPIHEFSEDGHFISDA
jgi:hypothetical protein